MDKNERRMEGAPAMATDLWSLFITFAKIGAFTLRGGYAMVPIMEKEIVDRKGWLTREEFMDILIVAQSTPGLFAINMASHIGNKARGVLGGVIGSLGVALPSIIAILLIAMFFQAFKENVYIEKIFMGVRPAVVALIAAPCFSMARTAKISIYNIWIPIVACLLITAFGVSPIWIILAAGLAGFVWGKVKTNDHTKS
jgi:chromate transporter